MVFVKAAKRVAMKDDVLAELSVGWKAVLSAGMMESEQAVL